MMYCVYYSFSCEVEGEQISTLFSLWCPLTGFPHFEQAGVFLFLVGPPELDTELDWQLASRVSCSSAAE